MASRYSSLLEKKNYYQCNDNAIFKHSRVTSLDLQQKNICLRQTNRKNCYEDINYEELNKVFFCTMKKTVRKF